MAGLIEFRTRADYDAAVAQWRQAHQRWVQARTERLLDQLVDVLAGLPISDDNPGPESEA